MNTASDTRLSLATTARRNIDPIANCNLRLLSEPKTFAAFSAWMTSQVQSYDSVDVRDARLAMDHLVYLYFSKEIGALQTRFGSRLQGQGAGEEAGQKRWTLALNEGLRIVFTTKPGSEHFANNVHVFDSSRWVRPS